MQDSALFQCIQQDNDPQIINSENTKNINNYQNKFQGWRIPKQIVIDILTKTHQVPQPLNISKKIIKKKNQKQNSHKWNFYEHKKYINFYLITLIKKPYLNISWNKWKINNIYQQAAQFIGQGLTISQVKSYDQRMKKLFTTMKKNQSLKNHQSYKECQFKDFIIFKAKELQKDDQNIMNNLTQLRKIESQESKHMTLLKKRIAVQEQIEQIIKQKFKKYD